MQRKYFKKRDEEFLNSSISFNPVAHNPSMKCSNQFQTLKWSWCLLQLHLSLSYNQHESDRRNKEVKSESWDQKNVSSQNAFHTALAEAKQLAVNNSVSYFSAWAGSQPFQSQPKGCLQNTGISSASRHESKVPRGGGVLSHTGEAGSFAKFVTVVGYPNPECWRFTHSIPKDCPLQSTALYFTV